MPTPASLPGFHSPGASTEAPLEMLSACHGRVASQCDTLQRLDQHLAQHGSDTAAREAATAVMRYFDLAAPHHHADEEQDLFPHLREAMAGSDAVCIRQLTDRLCAEHRVLEGQWQALRAVLQGIAQGQAVRPAPGQVDAFVAAYQAHIECEENELLPMATRLLADAQLAQIGQAMRQRRGIGPV